jgi:diguanylate cyclase (GGDEF)-like protein/PAS domain S-box-containing protein
MLGAVKDVSEQKRAELELHNHMEEVERFNRIALGREHRIIELKLRVNELSEMLGQAPPHPVPTVDDLEPHQQVEQQNFCVLPPREPGPLLEEEEFELSELFDLEQMQRLLDSFCGAIGIAAALIDLQGKVLIGSRWQRICTGFHRVNPRTLERCIESDTQLANQLRDGETFTLYQCRNGLTDAASPVRVGDRHVANVFVGQFLLEPADEQAFRRQAGEYGFDENDYLRALKEVPVVDRDKLPLILDFLVSFAKLAASMGLERLQGRQTQARLSAHLAELDRQRKAAVNLAEDAELARTVAERSEAALKTSEERFRTLVEQAADAVLLTSPHGRILDVNQEACRSLGYTRQELLTKRIVDIDPCAAESSDIGRIIEGLEPGQRTSFESVHRRKDGSEYPVEVSVGVLDLEGQRVSLGFSRDITERKLAEEKLRGAMERAKELELIINRSPATAWLWRVAPGWPVDYVSDSISAFGYTPEDFTSGRVLFSDIIHPDDLSKVNAEVADHAQQGRTEFALEYRIITKTGDIRWLSDWTWARKGLDGQVSHYQGVTLDITERKQAEQEQLAHLRFLESMDLVERAMRGTNDAHQMLEDVLDVALSVFGCDRAWLLHPCDPSATFWQVPIERTVPRYPGAGSEAAIMPMSPEVVAMMEAVFDSPGAVTYGPHASRPLPPLIAARFHIQAQMAMLIRTKTGSPWMLGLHQCSHPRVWTADEKRLLEEIGRRIGDSLSAMLTLRDLRESEQRFRCVVEQASDAVLLFTPQGQILDANRRVCESLGYSRAELLLMNLSDIDPTVESDHHRERIWSKLQPGQSATFEGLFRRRDQSTYPIEVSLGVLELDGQRVLLGLSRDISQRKQMEEELRTAAWTDKLTGLPNRALFVDRLQQAVLRAERMEDYRFAVLFLDFDRFKIINDSLGHKVGDQLLQDAAERLRTTVRAGDSLGRVAGQHTTARLGGDEFVVLLDGIHSESDASLVAGRLLHALSQPYHLGRNEVYSSVSIGIVTNDVAAAASAEDILRDADTAMYEAKLAGKGCYVVFDVSMRKRVQNRLSLEIDLRKAIDANQLFLMYQPIVSLETRQVESFEVLARWKHPARGLVSPAEFIPIAEDTGLIVPIGEWVLREACRQFAKWRDRHGDAAPRSLAVNLSRSQLLLADLPATIGRILEQSGLPPASLQLEITESAVMRDVDLVLRILHALKEIGVNLSMDDFGTGHSSLACLHQFPFDVLKVDQAFIATINHGRDHAALVHAVVSLARNLEISVVAEGIETADQLLLLQALGCQYGQGFFLGRPMMADQVIGYKVPLADPSAPAQAEPEKKTTGKTPASARG